MNFDKNIAKVKKQVAEQRRAGRVRAFAASAVAALLMGTMAFAGGVGPGMWGRGGSSISSSQIQALTGWTSNGTTTTSLLNVSMGNGINVLSASPNVLRGSLAPYVNIAEATGGGSIEMATATGGGQRIRMISDSLMFSGRLDNSDTGKSLLFPTAPTVSSGFGTSPSITVSNGSNTFRVNVGTGGVATSGVIGLPASSTGWNCWCEDMTTRSATVAFCRQTASTTTTVTIGNFTTTGLAAGAWVASDILLVKCSPL